jgi:hypothetical protein
MTNTPGTRLGTLPGVILKTAVKTPATETDTARATVATMLAEIDGRGEQAVRDYVDRRDCRVVG